jgi:hypothetical protein
VLGFTLISETHMAFKEKNEKCVTPEFRAADPLGWEWKK